MSSGNQVLITILIVIFITKCYFCALVKISGGDIEGTIMETRYGETFHAFLRIPYAEPPLNNLRFQAPEPIKPWTEVLNGTTFSPMCMQVNLLSDSEVSEDCLYLNVFTKNFPVDAQSVVLKPVVVYIHGGAFQLGSASDHKPNLLMERDIVLVTINYRLGAFGFLSLGTKEIPGNAGFKDQVLALSWVQQNIAFFGGDPNLVTILGNSAGAYGVTAHMVSPMSEGLFQRVIAFSGSITYQRKLQNNYSNLAVKLAEKMGCTTATETDMIDCLRQKPPEEFNLIELRDYPQCTIMTWFPVIEDEDFGNERFLIDDPVTLFRNGNFTKVPLIIGRTKDEFVDIPARMIENEIGQKLNEDYDEVAPHCFFYESGTEKSKNISKTLKKAYFPFDTIDQKSFNSLSNIFSDGYIGYGVHRLAHLISDMTNVFYYQLSFIGRYSFFNYPHNNPYGVHHSDEMQYIMTTVFVGPRIEITDPENVMVERFTRIVSQFALTGDPNNSTDEYLKEMNWPRHDAENEYYLDMGIHLIEKHGLNLERYSVWDSLESNLGNRNHSKMLLEIFAFIILKIVCT